MIKSLALSLTCLFFASLSHAGTQTPSSVKIKLKEFWVSTSATCSSPVLVYTNPTPSVGVEITTAPNLGNGYLAPGTYPCVMLVFSDRIEYTAVTTAGTCTAGTTYTKDLCHDGDSGRNVNGTTLTCADATEDDMTLYVSTASAVSGSQNSLFPPTTSGGATDPNGENLNTALVKVAGSAAAGTFQFVTTGALSDIHANCSPENISFRYVP